MLHFLNFPLLLISIIVPVYKAEKHIKRCIDSILAQTFKDWELILVDDGSTDKSGQICDNFAINDSRISVLHKENGGVASARNFGLSKATGDYIIQVDPDDWIDYEMLESLYKKAISTDADIIVCDFIVHQNNCTKIIRSDDCYTIPKQYITYNVRSSFWSMCNRLLKRSIIKENNLIFFEGVNFTEDRHFLIRYYYLAQSICFVHKPFYHYDCREVNSIVRSTDMISKLRQRVIGLEKLEYWFKDRTHEFDDFLEENRFWIKEDYYSIGEKKEFRNHYPELKLKFLYSHNCKLSISLRIMFFLASIHIDFPFDIISWLSKMKHHIIAPIILFLTILSASQIPTTIIKSNKITSILIGE